MKDILLIISENKITFEDFRKWLFIKLDKDLNKLKGIEKASLKFKIPYLLEYLEHKQVPLLEAICYYNQLSSNQANNFEQLLAYTIIEEFKRIELKKTYNYVPF